MSLLCRWFGHKMVAMDWMPIERATPRVPRIIIGWRRRAYCRRWGCNAVTTHLANTESKPLDTESPARV